MALNPWSSGYANRVNAVAGAREVDLRQRIESPQIGTIEMNNSDIEEMFAALGPVTIKRMFGGKGVYHNGRIVAVEVRDEMLLKADDITGPAFAAAGARRWAYEGKKGKPINMPYWSIPEDAFDDPDVMAHWVRLAYGAALRAK